METSIYLVVLVLQSKGLSIRLYLGIETVSCRLMQRIPKMDRGLKIEKVGPSFSILMLCPL